MSLKDINGGDPVFFQFARSGLVPFAFTGGGDHWCWYPQYAVTGLTPVVECPRDSELGRFYAPSFLGALYRRVLDLARDGTGWWPEPKLRQHLKRWSDDIGPLLPDRWRQAIAELQSAPLRITEQALGHTTRALLPSGEYEKLVRRDLAFPALDQEFKWMVD